MYNKSEVARLRERIECEMEAMRLGLTGLALGTARHRFIHARLRRVDDYYGQLATAVGEEAADETLCQVYNAVMERKDGGK